MAADRASGQVQTSDRTVVILLGGLSGPIVVDSFLKVPVNNSRARGTACTMMKPIAHHGNKRHRPKFTPVSNPPPLQLTGSHHSRSFIMIVAMQMFFA